MLKEEYKLTFFLNATHQVNIKNINSTKHPHSYEIVCYITNIQFIPFEEMENNVNQVLNELHNQYLNQLSIFKKMNPTLENLGRVLFRSISANLARIDCNLTKLSIAESPVRMFIINQ